jgi:hypothetical protein
MGISAPFDGSLHSCRTSFLRKDVALYMGLATEKRKRALVIRISNEPLNGASLSTRSFELLYHGQRIGLNNHQGR